MMTIATISFLFYWGIVFAGALSACVGLYLQMVTEADVPFGYSLGFYLFGLVIISMRTDLIFPENDGTVAIFRLVGLIVLISLEIGAAYYISKEYDVRGPIEEAVGGA